MISKTHRIWTAYTLTAFLIAGMGLATPARAFGRDTAGGEIVAADRGSGTISVISARTDQVIGTYDLPAGDNAREPMYVYAAPFQCRIFVGDRANSRVVAFDSRTFEVVGTASTDQGVFHMWGGNATGEPWVNCDVDNTTTVIDMRTLETVAVVPTPDDLVALGASLMT